MLDAVQVEDKQYQTGPRPLRKPGGPVTVTLSVANWRLYMVSALLESIPLTTTYILWLTTSTPLLTTILRRRYRPEPPPCRTDRWPP